MDAQTGTITEEEACAVEVAQRDEVLKFMKAAIDLETDVATQERTLELCCNEFVKRKPKLEQEKIPSPPKVREEGYTWARFMILFGVAIISLPFLNVVDFGLKWMTDIAGLLVIIPTLLIILKKKSKDRQSKEIMEAYQKKRQDIERRNSDKQKAYDTAIRECNQSITALRGKMEPEIAVSKEMLEKLYGKGEIYPKYCTLPALTSIYEYFLTGRCTELTGPHGAYNLYEDEVRKDTVISQLSSVIENLEQIRNNQYMLYQQVKDINTNTSAIVSEVQKIRNNTMQIAQLTALNAYYAARNERNTRISMYYNL